jgi:hypothetical protein
MATRSLKLATENSLSAASSGMRQDRQRQRRNRTQPDGLVCAGQLVCNRQRQSMSARVRPPALGRLQGRCGSTWRRRRSGVPPSRAGSAAWCVASCVFACGVLCVDPCALHERFIMLGCTLCHACCTRCVARCNAVRCTRFVCVLCMLGQVADARPIASSHCCVVACHSVAHLAAKMRGRTARPSRAPSTRTWCSACPAATTGRSRRSALPCTAGCTAGCMLYIEGSINRWLLARFHFAGDTTMNSPIRECGSVDAQSCTGP